MSYKEITFSRICNWNEGEPSPYINIKNPEDDIQNQIAPDEIVIPLTTIRILYRYPLSCEVIKEFDTYNPEGFTRAELAKVISKGYHQIYEEENTADKESNIPGMFNRIKTNGPYGIWGHCIGDLVLHTVEYVDTNLFKIGIDS